MRQSSSIHFTDLGGLRVSFGVFDSFKVQRLLLFKQQGTMENHFKRLEPPTVSFADVSGQITRQVIAKW